MARGVDGTAPEIIEGLKDTTAEATKDVTLKCKVDLGKPKATAEWYEYVNSFYLFSLDYC